MINKRKRSIYALLLVLALLVALPAPRALADGEDTAETEAISGPPLTGLSLTVNKGTLEGIDKADVVIDLYLIAAAKESSYGTYVYDTPAVTLSKDITNYDVLPKIDPKNPDKSREAADAFWAGIRDEAATAVLGGSSVAITAAKSGEESDKPITGLAAGLYLIVARGSELTELDDYRHLPEKEGESLYTIAYSPIKEFRFEPQIISIPYNGTNADPTTIGDWSVKAFTANMKPEEAPRYGNIEIIKALSGDYNKIFDTAGGKVTFVFHIVASLDGTQVYENYDSITMPTETSTIVKKIPAGATVKVEEIYQGANAGGGVSTGAQVLELPTDSDGSDEPALTFEASNEYNEKLIRGYGVRNTFNFVGGHWEYDGEGPAK